MPYIPTASLENLKLYKYSGKDLSLTSKYIMQPYWTFCASLLPVSIAPNMVTLIGAFFSTWIPVLVCWYAAQEGWHFDDPAAFPPWIWAVCGFCLFAYQTLDACDGKHARRTQTSSPLGELFDHGCDALFCPMLQLGICAVLGFSWQQRALHFLVVCNGLFFAIWEQYSTGTLDLWYINGPVEGILLTVGAFVWTTFAPSRTWWVDPVLTLPVVGALGLRDILFTFTCLMAVATVFTNVSNVLKLPRVHDRVTPFQALGAHLVVTGVYVAALVLRPSIFVDAPFGFEMGFGVVCAITATRLTLCRLCRFDYFPFAVAHVVFIAAVAVAAFMSHHTFVVRVSAFTTTAIGVVSYLAMAVSVFNQIARHLGIYVLSFTPTQEANIRKILSEAARPSSPAKAK